MNGYGAFYKVLDLINVNVTAELQTRNAPVARSGVVPGAIAWDECDQCGLLALSATRFFLTDEFPVEVVRTTFKQGAFLAGDLVVQLVRCAPQPASTTALAPSVTALDASGQQVLDDGYTLTCVVTETLTALEASNQIVDYLIRQVVFIGPQGACVGSEISFIVALSR